MASEWARKKAELLREEIWGAYESACEADAEGCEHTPDGDPLICWSCRERKFELVAESRIAAALDAARAEGARTRDKEWATTLWPGDPEGQAALETMTPSDGAAWHRTHMLAAESRGEQRGAERERWECYRIAVKAAGKSDCISMLIFGRGPMRGPEEE